MPPAACVSVDFDVFFGTQSVKTISMSKEDSEVAQAIILQYFPNTGDMQGDDLLSSRSRPGEVSLESRDLYSVTPYEEDLLLAAEKYLISLPECISECIIRSE